VPLHGVAVTVTECVCDDADEIREQEDLLAHVLPPEQAEMLRDLRWDYRFVSVPSTGVLLATLRHRQSTRCPSPPPTPTLPCPA
jgi:hypothetical protein